MEKNRKVYAKKTYYFLEPAESCPYAEDTRCTVRGFDVCKKNKGFYESNCCTSKYYDRCSFFRDRVETIKENKYFKASYCCPYVEESVCKLREVDVYGKNNKYYRYTCTTTDYIRKCPYFHDRVSRIRCKKKLHHYDRCPYNDGDWCTVRNINMRETCTEYYYYCCRKSNYIKCCPYYIEAACND